MNKIKAKIFYCESIGELNQIAKEIIAEFGKNKVILLVGELGAGKTSLVKEFAQVLACQEEITSPTYSIINEYLITKSSRIYHIDLYRLKTLEQAQEIGIADYLNSDDYCFIEWPQIIETILPDNVLLVKIEASGDYSRKIVVNLV